MAYSLKEIDNRLSDISATLPVVSKLSRSDTLKEADKLLDLRLEATEQLRQERESWQVK